MPADTALLQRALALLAQTLEEHDTCGYWHECGAHHDEMPRRLELDILALLDEAKALGAREG